LNYLRATVLEVGLLFNFGPRPQFRRLLFDNPRKMHHKRTPTAVKDECSLEHGQIGVHPCSSVASFTAPRQNLAAERLSELRSR
jgi:hypothetical protein